MCELSVYTVKGELREKIMEGIFGDSKEVEGRLTEVNIIAQSAKIVAP